MKLSPTNYYSPNSADSIHKQNCFVLIIVQYIFILCHTVCTMLSVCDNKYQTEPIVNLSVLGQTLTVTVFDLVAAWLVECN